MEELPTEILLDIAGYLARHDLNSLCRGNSRINAAINPLLYKTGLIEQMVHFCRCSEQFFWTPWSFKVKPTFHSSVGFAKNAIYIR